MNPEQPSGQATLWAATISLVMGSDLHFTHLRFSVSKLNLSPFSRFFSFVRATRCDTAVYLLPNNSPTSSHFPAKVGARYSNRTTPKPNLKIKTCRIKPVAVLGCPRSQGTGVSRKPREWRLRACPERSRMGQLRRLFASGSPLPCFGGGAESPSRTGVAPDGGCAPRSAEVSVCDGV